MTSRSDVPDYIAPVSTMGEIESRMGIPALESLLAERDELVKKAAPLRARHGFNGTWDDLRRVERATIAMRIRTDKAAKGEKVTEAYLEDASQADPAYLSFIAAGAVEKAEWYEAENRIAAIGETIQRANAVARYLTSELHLTP